MSKIVQTWSLPAGFAPEIHPVHTRHTTALLWTPLDVQGDTMCPADREMSKNVQSDGVVGKFTVTAFGGLGCHGLAACVGNSRS